MVRMTLVALWTEYNNRAWVRLGSMVSVNRRLQLGLGAVVEVLKHDQLRTSLAPESTTSNSAHRTEQG